MSDVSADANPGLLDWSFVRSTFDDLKWLLSQSEIWVPAVVFSVIADLTLAAVEWPFRSSATEPPPQAFTVMALAILARAWAALALCKVGLALLRRESASVLTQWVPVTTALRTGFVCLVLIFPTALAAVFFVLPGLYLLARWSQVPLLLIDGRAQLFDATEESWALVLPFLWSLVVIWSIVFGGTAVLAAGVSYLTASHGVIGFAVSTLAHAIQITVGASLSAVVYYQLSIRAPWTTDL